MSCFLPLCRILRQGLLPAVAGAVLLLPAMASAADSRAAGQSDSFARADADGDGRLDPEEFRRGYPRLKDSAFRAIDGNADGVVSRDEWQAFSSDHAAGMGQTAPGGARRPLLITPPDRGDARPR